MKKTKATKAAKEASYDLPEIPDYERAVLEKPREFDFGEFVPRDKSKLDRPATQVRNQVVTYLKDVSVNTNLIKNNRNIHIEYINLNMKKL